MAMDARLRERYSRQILFSPIGERGQERLAGSSVVLIGCGALGTALAGLLVRAGVGHLRIVDRDFVEASNLQRQTLFEEADARETLPKAIAAERHLRAVNSDVRIEGVVADLTPANADAILGGFSLLLDGTDNFETRLLINDYAVSRTIPWVYAAVVASYGVTMAIQPGQTACLACLAESDDAPSQPAEPTCDTAGVLGAAAGAIASLEAGLAIKLLLGHLQPADHRLLSCDIWTGRFQSVAVARRADCRACGRAEFRYLEGAAQPHLTLCGRDSVQIHEHHRGLDLAALGRQLRAAGGEVRNNDYLLRFRLAPYEITVFADGRAIIKGTRDPAVARSLYARYISS